MYKYEIKHITSVEEYIQAVKDGYLEFDHIDDLLDPIFEKLKELKDTNGNILFKYGMFLNDHKLYEDANIILKELSNKGNLAAINALAINYIEGKGLDRSVEKGVKLLLKASDSNFAIAQYNIGNCYYYGFGLPRSQEEGARMYLKAAEQGYAKAQNTIASCYSLGSGISLSKEKAFEWYKKAADQGYVSSIYSVATFYKNGDGVTQSYEKAIEYYQMAVKKNHSLSMTDLGYLYETGKGVPQSYEMAVSFYEKAAALDEKVGLCNLATLYKLGKGVTRDYKKSFELYLKSAQQNYARAQYNVGWCYYNGKGINQSYEKAVEWYQKAADKGYVTAIDSVGYAYYNGEGVEQSYEKAIRWFEKGANKNSRYCFEMLTKCYQDGLGVPQSYEKALFYCLKGAELKSGYCLNILGTFYQNGKGVSQNYELAFDFYQKAAFLGSVAALYNIGYCYQEGLGVPQDYQKAIEWYLKAAEKNHSIALLNIGVIYHLGKGVPQDYQKAIEYYRKAIEYNNVIAMKNLGNCYEFGQGVEIDLNKAVALYKQSAEKGYDIAQIRLACCYRDGIGVEKSLFTAFEWFTKAALQGNKSGQFYVGYFLEKYFNKPEKAVEWYIKSAEQGDGPSANNLGVLYRYGRGVPQDYQKAVEWYQKAVDNNHPIAMFNLSYFYQNGIGVPQDYQKALELLEKAYKLGYTQAKDSINEIRQIILEKEHEKLKVPSDVDIFISWNHHNLEFKEKIKQQLINNNIKVWDSDENAEGDLDLDVQYAIRHVKGYVILLSEQALKSSYMPKEVEWMFERIKKDGLNDTIIKIYIIGDSYVINNGLSALPKDHAFRNLIPLTMDFSSNEETIISFAQRVIRQNIVINYQRKIKEKFDVFPISLTDIILQQENQDVVASLEFENGFINRDLFDKDNHKYTPRDLLNLKGITFIHGEGGSGKSLYLKNLIRNFDNEDNLFFYLPCSSISKEFKNGNGDLISLIAKLSLMITDYHNVPLDFVNDIFRNEKKNFYIIFDGLDEAEEEKEEIINMINSFNALKTSDNISFIFASRNNGDAEKISSLTNKKVTSLTLNKMSDEDIIKLFDAIYERNKSFENEESKVSRPAFIQYLSLIADDIKKNPLLISNLIYIYFATKELQAQKAYILEKTNNIIINSLENERGTDLIQKEITNQLDVDLKELLQFVAFKICCNNDYSLEEAINDYFEENGLDTPSLNSVKELCKYLRSRRIIIGNRFSHNIYLSYFAALFIYRKIYKNKSDDFGYAIIIFRKDGEDKLNNYIAKRFSLSNDLWPNITADFVAKLDFEIHHINKDIDPFAESNPTYQLFNYTLNNLAFGISDIAKRIIIEISSKDNILYYAKLINAFFK